VRFLGVNCLNSNFLVFLKSFTLLGFGFFFFFLHEYNLYQHPFLIKGGRDYDI